MTNEPIHTTLTEIMRWLGLVLCKKNRDTKGDKGKSMMQAYTTVCQKANA